MIKRTDGSNYRLVGVNPLMENQDISEEKFILHNFDTTLVENMPKKKQKPKQQFKQEIEIVQIKEPIKKSLNYIKFNCLPAEKVIKYDELYREERVSVKYNTPFSFDGIIAESSDLLFKFWTQNVISMQSIIHESAERRWWVVQEEEKKEGWNGYLCVPSATTPHFALAQE
jgi:hypothetical protein